MEPGPASDISYHHPPRQARLQPYQPGVQELRDFWKQLIIKLLIFLQFLTRRWQSLPRDLTLFLQLPNHLHQSQRLRLRRCRGAHLHGWHLWEWEVSHQGRGSSRESVLRSTRMSRGSSELQRVSWTSWTHRWRLWWRMCQPTKHKSINYLLIINELTLIIPSIIASHDPSIHSSKYL